MVSILWMVTYHQLVDSLIVEMLVYNFKGWGQWSEFIWQISFIKIVTISSVSHRLAPIELEY